MLSPVVGDELNINLCQSLSFSDSRREQVRFVGTPDQPEWVAQDVGTILELQNIRQLLAKFDQD